MKRGALHIMPSVFCFKSIHSDRSYECTANVDVSERGIMLPGHSEVSVTAVVLRQLQLCTMLGSTASK